MGLLTMMDLSPRYLCPVMCTKSTDILYIATDIDRQMDRQTATCIYSRTLTLGDNLLDRTTINLVLFMSYHLHFIGYICDIIM